MSFSDYLWTTARDLRRDVMPLVSDPSARESLHNGLRIVTWIANALEARAPDGSIIPGSDGTIAESDRLKGPAENAAAWRTSAAGIAKQAKALDDGADLSALAAAIQWERSALDQTIARVDAIEYGKADANEHGGAPTIDRDALEAYLRRHFNDDALVIDSFRALHGGRSRQTALLTAVTGSGDRMDFVVQRGLPGAASSAAFVSEGAQFRLMERLHAAGMNIPRPVLVEEDAGPLGAAFLLTERAPGACAEMDFWVVPESPSIALDLAREMALLHAQPIDGASEGLPKSRERYDAEGWRQELDTLAATWHDNALWPSVTMSAAIAWLRANVDCLEDRRTLVHNDLLFHNIMVEDGRITAVLDWEQTSIGHPGEDLGYAYPQVKAMGVWEDFLAAYRAAGGADVSQRQIDYFALRAGVRLMGLVMSGGRDVYQNGLADGVLVASASAHFPQRLIHRIAGVLADVLSRDA